MPTRRTRANILPAMLALLLAATGAGCGEGTPGATGPAATATAAGQEPTAIVIPTAGMKSRLSPDDQALLEQARARGESEVVLLVAAERGRSREVAASIEALGGTIRTHNEDIGYISAMVPLDRVEAVAGLEGVQAVSLDEEIPIPDPRPDS